MPFRKALTLPTLCPAGTNSHTAVYLGLNCHLNSGKAAPFPQAVRICLRLKHTILAR